MVGSRWLAASLLVVGIARGTGYAQPQEIAVALPGGAQIEMVWIPPGTFLMGAPSEDANIEKYEGPQRQVQITRGGYIAKYELTQEQWVSLMETRPWSGQSFILEHLRSPATYLSWDDCQEFVKKLNETTGTQLYRLPTEAEWEYACRAGTTTKWSFGDDDSQVAEYAWYHSNTWPFEVYCHEVGVKKPNPWGLYDMHGNAWEWVEDWYGPYETAGGLVDPRGNETGKLRVTRSGIFLAPPMGQRSASRDAGYPFYREGGAGLRLWREAPPSTAVTPESWGAVKATAP